MQPLAAPIRNTAEIEGILTSLGGKPIGGLVLMPESFVTSYNNRTLILSLAARYRIPVMAPFKTITAEGGLISYGIDQTDLFRRAAAYVDRILKGAVPADLPVQLPTRFELAINLKTAKALGLTVSGQFQLLADEVIE